LTIAFQVAKAEEEPRSGGLAKLLAAAAAAEIKTTLREGHTTNRPE